jgi:hypothetical protein
MYAYVQLACDLQEIRVMGVLHFLTSRIWPDKMQMLAFW